MGSRHCVVRCDYARRQQINKTLVKQSPSDLYSWKNTTPNRGKMNKSTHKMCNVLLLHIRVECTPDSYAIISITHLSDSLSLSSAT